MRLMYHAIKNGVSDRRIREEAMPILRGVLAGQKKRPRAHSPVSHVQQDLGRCGRHLADTKVIEDQQVWDAAWPTLSQLKTRSSKYR